MNSNTGQAYDTEPSNYENANPTASGGRGKTQVRSGVRESAVQTSDTRKDNFNFETRLSSEVSRPTDRPATDSYHGSRSRVDISTKCYPPRPRRRVEICNEPPGWQNAHYIHDECGSGVVPHREDYRTSQRKWCRTPLTSYQASHGELGRQILCGEQIIHRTIESGPPCNICEYVLPLCRGYYRKYECEKAPCEQEYWSYKKRPRDKVEQYWRPCHSTIGRSTVNNFAPHNVALANYLKRKAEMDCTRKRKIFSGVLLFMLCAFVVTVFFRPATAQNASRICTTSACVRSASVLKKSLDEAIKPCDNFYKFACGNWSKTHPAITDFVPSSTIEERKYWNRKELHWFFTQANNESEPVAVHKARKLFSLCVDTDAIDKKGLQPFLDLMNRIGISLVPTKNFDLLAATAKMSKSTGIDMFYSIGVTPDSYNQTVNRIGISQPATTDRIPTLRQKRYPKPNSARPSAPGISKSEYTIRTVQALCVNDTSAQCQAYLSPDADISNLRNYLSALETATTKSYPKSNPKAIPNTYSLQYLQNLTNTIASAHGVPPLNWTRNLQLIFEDIENVTLDFSKPEELNLVFEEFFINDILNFTHSYSMKDHEFGMVWTLADTLALYSTYSLRNLKANYTSDLKDVVSRWSWCTDTVGKILGMAVSYYYATNETYAEIKNEVTEMVNNVYAVFKDIVKSASWIDEITKEKALKKVDYMKKYVAFPTSLANAEDLNQYYSDLEITDDFLESVFRKQQTDMSKELNSLNTINDLDKDRRILTPTEVNAFYDPERNTMIIPAGILGSPVYNRGMKVLDYGSIGSVIGHEITHGFDSQGRRYNYLGNLEEWWGNETLIDFGKRAQCFKDAYQNYSLEIEGVEVTTDGLLTLTENIADNGGFKQSLLAYKKYVSKNGEEPVLPDFDGFTREQLFTIGYANLWCEHPTLISSILASGSDHSPNGIRVNGVAMNSEEFSTIWNCPKGSNMNPNVDKCQLW